MIWKDDRCCYYCVLYYTRIWSANCLLSSSEYLSKTTLSFSGKTFLTPGYQSRTAGRKQKRQRKGTYQRPDEVLTDSNPSGYPSYSTRYGRVFRSVTRGYR